MKIRKEQRIVIKIKKLLFFVILILSFYSCDQFSRFNYENFNCGNNSTGINEILLNKVKIGSNIKLVIGQLNEQVVINKVSQQEVYFLFNNKSFKINRDNGSLVSRDNHKVTIVECKLSKFKM